VVKENYRQKSKDEKISKVKGASYAEKLFENVKHDDKLINIHEEFFGIVENKLN
jgi:thymidine phosphorylase